MRMTDAVVQVCLILRIFTCPVKVFIGFAWLISRTAGTHRFVPTDLLVLWGCLKEIKELQCTC